MTVIANPRSFHKTFKFVLEITLEHGATQDRDLFD